MMTMTRHHGKSEGLIDALDLAEQEPKANRKRSTRWWELLGGLDACTGRWC
jgi:hypothetical protein